MGQDKAKLIHLFNFVKDIYKDPDNKEFAAWVQLLVLDGSDVKQDINDIRKALGLRGKLSIDYSFVKEESVRIQLCVDNLRMENANLNLTLGEKERYAAFCVSAHLQVEGLMNYYYSYKYGNDISAIIKEVKEATAGSGYTDSKSKEWKSTEYKLTEEKEKKVLNVESIPIYNKLMAFFNRYKSDNPNTSIGYAYDNLDFTRKVRNNTFHRGVNQTEDNGKSFIPYPDVIRKDLQFFVELIKECL